MKVERRGFLRVIGLSPLAAKAGLDKAVAEQVGINLSAPLLTAAEGRPTPIDGPDAQTRRRGLLSYFSDMYALGLDNDIW